MWLLKICTTTHTCRSPEAMLFPATGICSLTFNSRLMIHATRKLNILWVLFLFDRINLNLERSSLDIGLLKYHGKFFVGQNTQHVVVFFGLLSFFGACLLLGLLSRLSLYVHWR